MDDSLSEKLDILIRLIANGLTKDAPTQKDKIVFLADAGLGPKEIGSILGKDPNIVSSTLTRERRKKKDGS